MPQIADSAAVIDRLRLLFAKLTSTRHFCHTSLAPTLRMVSSESSSDTSGQRNSVYFLLGSYVMPWDTHVSANTVEVVIDGAALSQRVFAVAGKGMPMLLGDGVTSDLSIWGPDPSGQFEAPEGFTPVLTCGCTVYGCGGAYASIRFTDDTVVWTDFRKQSTDEPIDVGQFVFDREQYERARSDFSANLAI
jgi:hypothetical protein